MSDTIKYMNKFFVVVEYVRSTRLQGYLIEK